MKLIKGGVTTPKGFRVSSTAAGIKYKDREDMALITSLYACRVAGTFTQNVIKAAPVIWDREIVKNVFGAQAIVVNSGIANACTGSEGLALCKNLARYTAGCLHIPSEHVLIASTGVIGMQLPYEKMCDGIRQMSDSLSDSDEAATRAAKSIMTTDTHEKQVAVEFEIGGKKVFIGGMCKGSGMIHPNMCTMLSFLTTDVDISQNLLQKALLSVVDDTYNMISVDGDTSTNDSCLILANGAAGNTKIDDFGADYDTFVKALHLANEELAKMMAGDGEGATCLFEVKVINADSKDHAKILAKSVVTSSLTKAAINGHDANWGRILCALGYSGVDFNPNTVDLYFESDNGKIQITRDSVALEYSEDEATHILSAPRVSAICDMKMGDSYATSWGCDLSHEYVSINADYRS